ncbi:MAG: sugar phosphate isomerase/epimerase [Parasphingorhabdus sp.]|uniref:sugar phosphate isomerase/epimerase family protein n=1 Tax=Parasphingorhabdus sp. TaxID=2709688 RepID=UPI0032990C7F
MKLAISNIAWPANQLENALAIMQRFGARGLEIAPGLAFYRDDNPFVPDDQSIREFSLLLSKYGVRPVSMQSLLFGVDGALLFGKEDEKNRFKTSLMAAIQLAERVEIPNLVMGSPRNRIIPSALDEATAIANAVDVFYGLGEYAKRAGVKIALEPNPKEYGTNFLNTMLQTINFAEQVDHQAVTVNFDIGALHMTGEIDDAAQLFHKAAKRISHIHISAPNLEPAPKNAEQFSSVAANIAEQEYKHWFSIEMRAVEGEELVQVEKSLKDCSEILTRLDRT